MAETIDHKLSVIRSRARGLIVVYGLGRTLCVVAAVVAGYALFDFAVRPSGWTRAIGTMSILAVAAVSLWRNLIRPLRVPLTDLQLAFELSRSFPALGRSLPSAVQFAEESGPRKGGPEKRAARGAGDHRYGLLRQKVVVEAERRGAACDFSQIIESRPAWRWMRFSLGTIVVFLVILLWQPLLTWTALARIAHPLRDTPWPQTHRLQLLAPADRVQRGGTLHFAVYDERGVALPSDLEIQLRMNGPDGAAEVVSIPCRRLPELERQLLERSPVEEVGPPEPPETGRATDASVLLRAAGRLASSTLQAARRSGIAFANRPQIAQPIAFRVVGGDDRSMPWQEVLVLDPPRVERVEVTLAPPEYTGLAPEAGGERLRVLPGTAATFQVTVDKALESARLLSRGGNPVSCRVTGSDRRTIEGTATLLDDDLLALRVRDDERLDVVLPCQWAVQVVADTPPVVRWIRPIGNLRLLPSAEVPMQWRVEDDLGVDRVTFRCEIRRSHLTETGSELLWSRADETTSGGIEPKPAPGFSETTPRVRTIAHNQTLETMRLAPGDEITAWVEAVDAAQNTSESPRVRIDIVSMDDLSQTLDARRARLIETLRDARALATVGSERTRLLEAACRDRREARAAEVSSVRSLVYLQQQVEELLTAPDRGALAEIDAIAQDLDWNRLGDSTLRDRLTRLGRAVSEIAAGPLQRAASRLSAATKTAAYWEESDRADATAAAETARCETIENLHHGAGDQEEVASRLEEFLAAWSASDSRQRRTHAIEEIRSSQATLLARTSQLARQTLGREQHRLAPSEVVEAAAIAREQTALAEALGELLAQDAAATATQRLLPGRMRDASRAVQQNRLAEAAALQQELVEALSDLRDDAMPDEPPEAGTLAEAGASAAMRQLAELRTVLGDLIERQTVLLESTRAAGEEQARNGLSRPLLARIAELAVAQGALAADAQALREKLPGAVVVESTLGRAAAAMREAQTGLGGRDLTVATLGAQERALWLLSTLAASFESPEQGRPEADDADQEASSERDEPGRRQSLIQLRMLHALQTRIYEETRAVDQQQTQGPVDREAVRAQLAPLAARQDDLAQMLLALRKSAENASEAEDAETAATAEGSVERDRPGVAPRPLDATTTAEDEDPLLDVAWRMQAAAGLLEQGDSGRQVQTLQEEVQRQLAQWIAAAEKAGGGSPRPMPPDAASSAESDPSSPGETDPAADDAAGAEGGEAGTTPGAAAAGGSGADAAATARAQRAILHQVWGQLPESQRARMFDLPTEEFLPEYHRQIEAYFRSLAHEAAGEGS